MLWRPCSTPIAHGVGSYTKPMPCSRLQVAGSIILKKHVKKTDTITAMLSEADLSSVIAMAWQDDTPFEAIAQQFGLNEPQVIALMRASLKARSFRLWRMRVRGRKSKHLGLDPGQASGLNRLQSQTAFVAGVGTALSDASEDFPLPPSPLTLASLR